MEHTHQSQSLSIKQTQEAYLSNFGIQKSFLTIHNFGSNISEFLEIGMPYMILYNSFNYEADHMVTLEFTEATRNYMYASYNKTNKVNERPFHSHNFYELTIVLSGEIQLKIENEIVTYKEGECCLCNRNIHHQEIPYQNCDFILFLFKEEYIRSVLAEDLLYDENGKPYTRDSIFQRLFLPNQKIPFYTAKEYIDFRRKEAFVFNELVALLNTILLEIAEKRSGRSYLMKGYLCRLIDLLSDPQHFFVESHQTKFSKEEDLLYQISTLMEETNGQITRQELEQKLNYNSDYMNRIIKKLTGKTLMEYSKIFLLNEAVNLLKNTTMKIGEICDTLGYTNRNYFNKIFYERYGMTPTEYRHKDK